VLVTDDRFAAIRRRPTYTEMMERDTLPPWLKTPPEVKRAGE
jgi:diaminopimelate decarboxylase